MENRKNRRRYDGFKFVHKKVPNYLKARIEIKGYLNEKVLPKLTFLYEEEIANEYISEIERICKLYYAHKAERMIEAEKKFDPKDRFSERDVVLITYGDLI